jgi:hypothetical protein
MKFYTKQHQFYCGIDLHARKMYLCVLDSLGTIVLHSNMNANAEALVQAIAPFDGTDLVIAVECIFSWYWVADFCAQRKIPFVLGHALYMKAIHGSKTKNILKIPTPSTTSTPSPSVSAIPQTEPT